MQDWHAENLNVCQFFSQFSNNAAIAVKRRPKPSVSVASVGKKSTWRSRTLLRRQLFFSSSTLYCSSVTTVQNNTLPLSPSSRFHNPNHRTFTQNVLALKNSVSKCWKMFCCFPLFHYHPSVLCHNSTRGGSFQRHSRLQHSRISPTGY